MSLLNKALTRFGLTFKNSADNLNKSFIEKYVITSAARTNPKQSFNINRSRKVTMPSIPSGILFTLHNNATGNALTRRMPRVSLPNNFPVRSRAMRYRG